MADPVRKLERARRDARRFAADARRLAARGRKRLAKKAREDDRRPPATRSTRRREERRPRPAVGGPARARRALGRAPRAPRQVAVARVRRRRSSRRSSSRSSSAPSSSRGSASRPARWRRRCSRATTCSSRSSPTASGSRSRGVRLGGDPPRRGDVVVFESPRTPGVDVVKRVVGVPGDVVELREQVLCVNGVPQPRTPAGEVALRGARARRPGRRSSTPAAATARRSRSGALAPASDGDPAAIEASWQAAAAAGVATYEVLQCRRARLASRRGPVPGGRARATSSCSATTGTARRTAAGAGGWQVPRASA